jgi:hypothetical protein
LLTFGNSSIEKIDAQKSCHSSLKNDIYSRFSWLVQSQKMPEENGGVSENAKVKKKKKKKKKQN